MKTHLLRIVWILYLFALMWLTLLCREHGTFPVWAIMIVWPIAFVLWTLVYIQLGKRRC